MRPYELRPPLFLRPVTSDFSGSLRVTSARSDQVEKRRPGLVGLCFLIAIAYSPSSVGVEARARKPSLPRKQLAAVYGFAVDSGTRAAHASDR